MAQKVLFINCTPKKSPEESNTRALCNDVAEVYEKEYGLRCDFIRVVDFNVLPGIESDMGKGDEWPEILERIKDADIIIVATPIWIGNISSLAQRVFERLEGTYSEGDPDNGQYPLYNKVGGAVITGTEDGAHFCAKTIQFCLMRFGCTIPPGADCYWVGPAGPGPSYIAAEGGRHLYTNRTKRTMVANTVFMAELLAKNRIPTNLLEVEEKAAAESTESIEIDWRSASKKESGKPKN
ncbi:MAG TPA: flavodoxin family protein [Candidatus Krumholzibacteriaceae bacterium]|nr:flavodoxin family protein [Candidatus Krumholzibacteriaceae bacterium]